MITFLYSIFRKSGLRVRILSGTLLFLLPLSVLLYSNFAQTAYHIEFANKESLGNRIQRPLVELLAEPNYSPKLGSEVISAARALGLEAELSKVLSGPFGGAGTFDSKLTRALISRTGDNSNLTLDPEMDSYYLADVSSVVAAQSLDRFLSLERFVLAHLQKRVLTEEERASVSVFVAQFSESDMQRIQGDIETAIAENGKATRGASPTLSNTVTPLLANYLQKQIECLEVLKRIAKGDSQSLGLVIPASNTTRRALVDLAMGVSQELDSILDARSKSYRGQQLRVICGTVITLFLAYYLLVHNVNETTRALRVVIEELVRISNKDLSGEVPKQYLDRRDEVGELARASSAMTRSLSSVLRGLHQGVSLLRTASLDLKSSTSLMNTGVGQTVDSASSSAVAAEEMSANMSLIANVMDQTTRNLKDVAGASEQMTQNIGRLSRSAEEVHITTAEASRQADDIAERMQQLTASAASIGQVTATIQVISAQTNLLALNASIEAARAGASGKGFAVVANEIKSLAQQTAIASEDIRHRIQTVQAATAESAEEILKVSARVLDVRNLVQGIRGSVAAQEEMARRIATNILNSADGMTEVNDRVSESALVSTGLAKDAAQVDQVAKMLDSGNSLVMSKALELDELAQDLSRSINEFQVSRN